ncbi:creatininase family protein [Comamonas kerstersii]|uniref:Creatininase n=1 Tax=Comamonas kerstersii TaxID=225992 RepID=A0A0W7Z593_9BURK|nr:creatininase family protein [Comamonas kerstersii]KUF42503.1 creatininase [Comamonas kerstersii]OOH84992.1 creatininase [Comamonas kerstersii]OOH95082.1 creatininase [Comamonas kerstersii]
MADAAALQAWPSRRWADVSARDFALAQRSGLAAQTVAILPVGAVEQHGPHLPLKVDTALVEGVVDAALPLMAADVPVLVLPTQAIGLSLEHQDYAGTLSLSPATLLAVWTELGVCVARAGVKKLLIFNAHGGNVSSMDIVARQLRMQCGLLVYHSSWFNLPQPAGVNEAFSAHEHRFGVHGGETETSMMLHLAPELVRMEHARNFASSSEVRARQFPILGNGKSAKLGWAMQDYNPQGAAGNAAAADAQRGQALVQGAAASLAQLCAEIHALPEGTVGGQPQPLG